MTLNPWARDTTLKRAKGKIPNSEWTAILSRHEEGESFASIARSYGCTPPAIRYIVGRKGGVQPSIPGAAVALNAGTAANDHPAAKAKNGRLATAEPTISTALKDRVNSDLASFIVAFDAVVEYDTPEHRKILLEATDRLLRAGARTRIELERRRLPSTD
jgi:hypothetical protein